MRRSLTFVPIAFAIFGLTLPCLCQTVPETHEKALDGTSVSFPTKGSQKPLLLMLGFSHQSSTDFQSWNKLFTTPYTTDPRVEYFELVDLQGVPSFVNGMILHGMRRAVPKAEGSHFAPFYSHEQEWKRLVGFADPKIAYLVLADSNGRLVWHNQGPATREKSLELESAIQKLIGVR